jgi:adenine-specific DNA-methyltransferase
VRYIGNKTKLLSFIRHVLKQRGVGRGVAVDPFSGTASVARELKRLRFAVIASDIMEYAHVLAQAYVQATAEPAALRMRVRELNRLPAREGFLSENFSTPRRMYFTRENALRIEAMRTQIEAWRAANDVDHDTYYALLAALIEASDRVANTTGVYAAYVKSWQPNALRPLELRTRRIIPGNSCHAHRADALTLVKAVEPFELLYLDPPYNARQYSGYYHVPELIALGWFAEPPQLRGKTGLLPDRDKRTDWSRRSKCETALEALLASARCRHIVMSYNAEGIIPEKTIERLFKSYGRADTYQKYPKRYRRYRSDADGEKRQYSGDVVTEYLYCVAR